ncbi:MAG: twin-arginine translocation signal domain-containing protein, partial [Candidatus Hydrogenedentes bacterium]|nr:twin-arginine translocation signal domain-containing protein [Candidatus Hydrogenedentota bacterium]
MERRDFVAACAAAATAGAAVVAGADNVEASQKKVTFADAPLKMSIQPKWFPGKQLEPKLPEIAAWGFSAFEQLNLTDTSVRPLMDKLGLVLSCRSGAGEIRIKNPKASFQMVNPADHDRIVEQFKKNVEIAKKLNCKTLVGLTGQERHDVSRDNQKEYGIACIKRRSHIAKRKIDS